eukprot:g9803.t1
MGESSKLKWLQFDFIMIDKSNITEREKLYSRDNSETTSDCSGNSKKKRKLNDNSSLQKSVRKTKKSLPFKEFSPKNIDEVVKCSINGLCIMVNDVKILDIDDHTFVNSLYYGEESDAGSDSDESYSEPDRSGGNGNTEKYQDWLNRVANESMEGHEKDLQILISSETNPGTIPKELVPDIEKDILDLIKNSEKKAEIENRKREIETYCQEIQKYVKIGQAVHDEMNDLFTEKAKKEERILLPEEFTFYSFFKNDFEEFKKFVDGKENITKLFKTMQITKKQLWDNGKNMLQKLLDYKSRMYCAQKARNELLNCCGFEIPGYWYKGTVKRIG